MPRSVGDEELMGRGRIASYVEEDAAHAICRLDGGLVNGRGLGGMLKGHFKSIVPELIKSIMSYVLIADVDLCGKAGELDVDPPGVFRLCIKKGAVSHHVGIDRIFKAVWVTRLIEYAVLMLWEVYFEVPPSFEGKIAVTGQKEGGYYATNSQDGEKLCRIQFKHSFLR
jgi:hypothetical protein